MADNRAKRIGRRPGGRVDPRRPARYKEMLGISPGYPRSHAVSISERKKELKRRRHRTKKIGLLNKRLKKATVSEKAAIAEKVRKLTPGCEQIIGAWGLEGR